MLTSNNNWSGEPVLEEGEHEFLVFGRGYPCNLVDFGVNLLDLLLRAFLLVFGLYLLWLLPHWPLVLQGVLRVLALLALTGTPALHAVVVALTILLQTVGFLTVAGPLPSLHLHAHPQPILIFAVVLAPHTFAQLIAPSSFVNDDIPWVKHSQ